jgi:hypothetical protein
MPALPSSQGSSRRLERFWLCTQRSAKLTVVLQDGPATVKPRFLELVSGEIVEEPETKTPFLA